MQIQVAAPLASHQTANDQCRRDILRNHRCQSDTCYTQMTNNNKKQIKQVYLDENGKWGAIDADRWNLFYSWLYENGLTSKDLAGKGFYNEWNETDN